MIVDNQAPTADDTEAVGPSVAEAPAPRAGSLTDTIEAQIERMILTRELRPGAKINEHALASRLGISRAPIREACRRLERMGLVVIVMNRGVFVRRVGLKEALDVYEVRAALARQAGRLVAQRIRPDQLSVLEDLVRRMDEIERTGDVEAYFHVNLAFHERLMAFTGNARLAAIYQGLVKELHLFRWRSFEPAGNLRISNAEHKRILDAIAAHDPVHAGRAFERHVELGRKRLLDTLGDEEVA